MPSLPIQTIQAHHSLLHAIDSVAGAGGALFSAPATSSTAAMPRGLAGLVPLVFTHGARCPMGRPAALARGCEGLRSLIRFEVYRIDVGEGSLQFGGWRNVGASDG